jgi:bifunctional DNase/RNase
MKSCHWITVCLLLVPLPLWGAQDIATLEAKIKTLMVDPNTQSPVVVLESVADKRLLPIWIDVAEARAIALEIEQIKTPRPLTHDLFRNVLSRLGVTVERVVITELRNSVYYALLYLKSKGQNLQIDARPSDALALALKARAPVFVAEQVFASSKSVPAAQTPEESRLKLGVQTQDLTPELAAAFEAGVTSGVVVSNVEAGGPAAAAGIEPGDIIVKANDTAMKTAAELNELLRARKTPGNMKLEIVKKGKPVTVQLELRP